MTPDQKIRLPRYAQDYIEKLERSFDLIGSLAYVVLGFSLAMMLVSLAQGFAIGQILSSVGALLALLVVHQN